MVKITFETDRCKGCGLCITACPKQLLIIDRGVINAKGHYPAAITDAAACVGCGNCAVMCPDCVITIER